jgi:hypothetical protein
MQSVCWSCLYAVHVGAAQVVACEGAALSEQGYLMAWPLSLAMCPQRLVNRDGNVSGTKDRDGIDPRDLLKFESCPSIGGSSSILLLWCHSCHDWNKNFRWPSILVVIGYILVWPRSLWALVICKPSSYRLLSWSTWCAVIEQDTASWKKPKLFIKSLGGYCPSFHDEILVVIWFLEASILHCVGNLVGNCSCHFCFTQALRWERLRELSDYCIVQLLNALSDYFSSLLLSDRDCESQLRCESD